MRGVGRSMRGGPSSSRTGERLRVAALGPREGPVGSEPEIIVNRLSARWDWRALKRRESKLLPAKICLQPLQRLSLYRTGLSLQFMQRVYVIFLCVVWTRACEPSACFEEPQPISCEIYVVCSCVDRLALVRWLKKYGIKRSRGGVEK